MYNKWQKKNKFNFKKDNTQKNNGCQRWKKSYPKGYNRTDDYYTHTSTFKQRTASFLYQQWYCNFLRIFLVQVRLGTKVLCKPNSNRPGFKLMTSDRDCTLHVTETPALTTRPSVALKYLTNHTELPHIICKHYLYDLEIFWFCLPVFSFQKNPYNNTPQYHSSLHCLWLCWSCDLKLGCVYLFICMLKHLKQHLFW